MGLNEKISEDLKAAMKSGDKIRLETLRMIRAALKEREIEKRGSGSPMSADDDVSVLISAAKRRKESIELFQKGGRMDLVEQEGKELAIIQEYLPKQATHEEIQQIIREAIRVAGAVSAADFGKVMPAVMKQLKGRADGQMIQELVKQLLG